MGKRFESVAARPGHPEWERYIAREGGLYPRQGDIRSEFARDYTRILHCCAYRRLKHKTQVFFNIGNDHVCTRIEHVAHVESVATTIGNELGLNVELIRAIAIGHDLGHAPFGHQGESVLNDLSQEHLGEMFWHEKNGLRFVDSIELLEDSFMVNQNLKLTYAVRDGIISHCGEVDENRVRPRTDAADLSTLMKGTFQPATWEACVVKLADKIAYVGRDIEDAIRLGFLSDEEKASLLNNIEPVDGRRALNTTVIIHNLITDICLSSAPERGICLSAAAGERLDNIKRFNDRYIYQHPRLLPFKKYAELIIGQVFQFLYDQYEGADTIRRLRALERYNPKLIKSFVPWIKKYMEPDALDAQEREKLEERLHNVKIYGKLETRRLYAQAIIEYISGMTDRFAIEAFQELISF